jgi:hypothetical protein
VYRNGIILVVLSVLAGGIVSFSVATTERILTCHDNRTSYSRHNRGFPLAFASGTLEIPRCKKFDGPRCSTAVCDNFGGLKESASFRPGPLLADVAVWSLFAAGILYMVSAFIIRI